MALTILHTNDLHGSLTAAKAERIREIKNEAGESALYCDTGDCIKAGNLAIPLRQDPAWEMLGLAGCDVGVIGNRESHVLQAAFEKKIAGHQHPLVCANLRRKDETRPLLETHVIDKGGMKIGIVGVMVPMVTERMATAPASAYLWDPPIPTAIKHAEALRPDVDCLIALTHIGFKQDQELAEKCPYFDLILGGHSHTLLDQPVQIGNTFICQGGSHGKFVGRYLWQLGKGITEYSLISLPA